MTIPHPESTLYAAMFMASENYSAMTYGEPAAILSELPPRCSLRKAPLYRKAKEMGGKQVF